MTAAGLEGSTLLFTGRNSSAAWKQFWMCPRYSEQKVKPSNAAHEKQHFQHQRDKWFTGVYSNLSPLSSCKLAGLAQGLHCDGRDVSTYESARTIRVLVTFSIVNFVFPPFPAILPIALDRWSPFRGLTKMRTKHSVKQQRCVSSVTFPLLKQREKHAINACWNSNFRCCSPWDHLQGLPAVRECLWCLLPAAITALRGREPSSSLSLTDVFPQNVPSDI